MKIILLSFLTLSFLSGFSQDKLSVKYRAEFLSVTNMVDSNHNSIYKWFPSIYEYELNISDKMSSFREIVPVINENLIASRTKTRSVFLAYTDLNSVYSPVQSITEKPLMISESIKNLDWHFGSATDTIVGFPCRMATAVYQNVYVYAWYAYELPAGFGPFTFTGLPGTVLAVSFSNTDDRYMAYEISEDAVPVNIPADASIISRESYALLSTEKRKYRAGLFGKRVDPAEVPRKTANGIPSVAVPPAYPYFQQDPSLPPAPSGYLAPHY